MLPANHLANDSVSALFNFLITEKCLTNEDLSKLEGCDVSKINELLLDSRKCSSTSIFVAIFGNQTRGHDYLDDVAKNGCPLALVESIDANDTSKASKTKSVATISNGGNVLHVLSIDNLSEKLAGLAQAFYFTGLGKELSSQERSNNEELVHSHAEIFPSIVAITGTNGKTSVAAIYAQIMSCFFSLKKGDLNTGSAASIGTLGINIFNNGQMTKLADTINTTPDILSVYSQLAKLSHQDCRAVAIEASSHALEQNRIQGLPINGAIFTNLSQDHLDYHTSMQEYASAKRKLLLAKNLRYVVLNADDPESHAWESAANPKLPIYWYSSSSFDNKITSEESDSSTISNTTKRGCWAEDISYSTAGISFTLCSNYGEEIQSKQVNCPLIGTFNVSNILAALTATLIQLSITSNKESETAKEANSQLFTYLCECISAISGVPGRMELFSVTKTQVSVTKTQVSVTKTQAKLPQQKVQAPTILVDYAHTPDALKQALRSAKAHTEGQLVCVFGCGGNRDKSKRSQMGKVASEYANKVVLTQDNSRNEAPSNIVNDIKSGMPEQFLQDSVCVELDRKKAIAKAWQLSTNQDMILVAGKGHEDYIEVKDERIAYNEREFVAQFIQSVQSNIEPPQATGTLQ